VTILFALLLCLVLPGLAGGVFLTWFSPDPSRPGALLGRALSCGVAAWLLSSGLLARTVGLTRASSWTTEVVLGVASLVVLCLPRSRAVLRGALPEIGYLATLVLVAGATWWPVGALVVRTTWGPVGSTPWYYWSLASKVAEAGHVPATTTEWATTTSFLDDYHLFSTGTAMLLTQDGAAAVRVLQVVVLVSMVLMACGAALLANALGSGRLASLAAVPVVVATGAGAVRLTSYRPEGFALGLMLLLVAVTVEWFRHRDRGSLIAGCLLVAVLSQVHGIALLTGGVLLVGAAVAFCPRTGWWPYVRRCVLAGLAFGASAVVLALAIGGSSGTEHSGGLGDKGGLADPTWQFFRGIKGLPPSIPPRNRQLLVNAIDNSYDGRAIHWIPVALVLATVVLLVAAIRKRSEARQVLVFAVLSLLGVGAVAAVFAFGWSSYVPRRTGGQRLVQDMTPLVAPYLACALAFLPLVGRRVAWRRGVSIAVVIALCVVGMMASSRLARGSEHQRPSPRNMQTLASLKVPHDAVVLANAYTEGYLENVMGADGLLEGRAPYTFPRLLLRANRLLKGAREFYTDPSAHLDYLERNHVSYVIVSRRHSFALATGNFFQIEVPRSRFDAVPGLTQVRKTLDLTVYRVDRAVLEQ
jgi:hypothetical protein